MSGKVDVNHKIAYVGRGLCVRSYQ